MASVSKGRFELNDAQLAELKAIELEILDEFLRLCEVNDIDYFLSGGTCLGAIRHKGFIPWDDDIDISMSRSNYEKLATVCKTQLDERFVFQNYETEPRCGLVFGKIRRKNTIYSESYSYKLPFSQGIWVDIFPYDRISDDPTQQDEQYTQVQLLKNMYIVKCGYGFPENKPKTQYPAYLAAKAATAPLPLNKLIARLHKRMIEYDTESTSYVFPFGGAYSPEVERMPAAYLDDLIDVEFEGRICKTLANYDAYLSNLYGDYMELPPVEKRRSGVHYMHEFKSLEE